MSPAALTERARLEHARLRRDQAELDAMLEQEDGLPERLPDGERILWQGQPDWRLMAVHVLHVRMVVAAAVFFSVLSPVLAVAHGSPTPFIALALAAPVLAGSAASGLSLLSAWLLARISRYTITDARLVMRVGLIVPINLNIPLAEITDVAIRPLGGGAADLPVRVRSYPRVYHMLLWPHVRPFRYRRTEPMLRAVKDGEAAGRILAGALREAERSYRLKDEVRTERRAPILLAAE